VRTLINRLEEGLMATLLAFMTLLTFVQVGMRYLFNSGWTWSLEATTYSFAALVLIGMSYGVRTRTHITVDLIVSRLAPAGQKAVRIVAILVCLAYAGLMLYGALMFVDRLMTLGNMARDVPLPKWVLTATMPLGFVLLAFRLGESAFDIVRGRKSVREARR
jgi:C4-dicarboxylate transporter DctQ subunit